MSCIVELLDDRVRDELEALPLDMQARFRRIVELIQEYGLAQVREPHENHAAVIARLEGGGSMPSTRTLEKVRHGDRDAAQDQF